MTVYDFMPVVHRGARRLDRRLPPSRERLTFDVLGDDPNGACG